MSSRELRPIHDVGGAALEEACIARTGRQRDLCALDSVATLPGVSVPNGDSVHLRLVSYCTPALLG